MEESNKNISAFVILMDTIAEKITKLQNWKKTRLMHILRNWFLKDVHSIPVGKRK